MMTEEAQQRRKHLIPPIRLKQVDAPEQTTYLVFLPLSTPIYLVEECMRAHVLGWSVWKSCEHTIEFLDGNGHPMSDEYRSFKEYDVQLLDDVFFRPVRKSSPTQLVGLEGPEIDALAGERFSINIVRFGSSEKTLLTVRPKHTLILLQAQIELLVHIPLREQRLIWKGEDCSRYDETVFLEDLGMEEQSQLWLLHKRQVAHGPCICWYLNDYLHEKEEPYHRLSPEMLNDPTVLQMLEHGPPPAYDVPSL